MQLTKGTGKADLLTGVANDTNEMWGNGGDDKMTGQGLSDVMLGGGGNDTMSGNAGDDVMVGGTTRVTSLDGKHIVVGKEYTGKFTFLDEGAGYKNAIGMYEIDPAGRLVNVQVLFANASKMGSGGTLKGGESIDVNMTAGNKVGFFILPNGYSHSKDALEKAAKGGGHFELRDDKGKPGTIDGGPVKLTWVDDKSGAATVLKGEYGSKTYHDTKALNADNFGHVRSSVDAKGVMKVGFEDLDNGGDKDFDDVVYSFEVTQKETLHATSGGPAKPAKGTDNDVIDGGTGNDKIWGMAGHDALTGGDGDDQIWGNSGNDTLEGGSGNDVLRGGKDNDVLDGGAGNDALHGDSGDDLLMASAGNDYYEGGAGNDMLSYERVEARLDVDLGKHVVRMLDVASGKEMAASKLHGIESVRGSNGADHMKGSSGDNVMDGGAGNDWLRGMSGADRLTGGKGADTFAWLKKDVIGSKADHVTDFELGTDKLDLSDFLKGTGVKGVTYADVVKLADAAGAKGAAVMGWAEGSWHEIAVLDGLDAQHVTLHDLGL